MRRRLFAFASAVSLLIFAATVAAWIRSHYTADNFDELRYLTPDLSMQAQGWVSTTTQEDAQITLWNGGLYITRVLEQQNGETWAAHPWQRTRPFWAVLTWQRAQPSGPVLNGASITVTKPDDHVVAQAKQWVREAQDAERQNNYDDALKFYSKAANLDPTNSIAVQARDHTLILMGRDLPPASFDPYTSTSVGLNPFAWDLDPANRKPDIGLWFSSGHMRSPPDDLMTLSIPLWPIVTIAAILPLASLFYRHRRRRRLARGLCQSCSYNLTGNTSGVCPECGAAVAEAPKVVG